MDDYHAWIAFAQLRCLTLSQKHSLLRQYKTLTAIFDSKAIRTNCIGILTIKNWIKL